MDRRRLALTVLFFLLLFSLLPLSIWVMNTFDFPWLFLVVMGVIVVGYALLWPYRLVFLGLLLLLSGTGLLYQHGDLLFSLLFFLVPYGVACVAIAYRLAERLSPVEWVEPEYPEEGLEEPAPRGPVLNPWAHPRRGEAGLSRHTRRGQGGSGWSETGEAEETGGEEGDPCGGDELLDLLLERGTEDPEAERRLREYMECRAKWFIEHFDEYEKRSGIRVKRGR